MPKHKTTSKRSLLFSKYTLRLACAGMMVLQIVQLMFVYSMYTPSISTTHQLSLSPPVQVESSSFLTYIPKIANLKTKVSSTHNPQRMKLLQDAIAEIQHDTHVLIDEMFSSSSVSSYEKKLTGLAEKMSVLIDVGSKKHRGLDTNQAAMRDTTTVIKCTSATSPQDIETQIFQIHASYPKIRIIISGKTTWSRRATKSRYVMKLGDVSLKYILERVVRTPYVLYVDMSKDVDIIMGEHVLATSIRDMERADASVRGVVLEFSHNHTH